MYHLKNIIDSLTTYIISLSPQPLTNLRYQVNPRTYVSQFTQPNNPQANVLLIKGGQQDPGCNSFYVRILCKYLPNTRVFILDKNVIMLNHRKDAIDIDQALEYLRNKYSQPVYLVGASLGGVVVSTYLVEGYDRADGYMAICSSINVLDFQQRIMEHFYFRSLVKHICRQYSVNNLPDLYRYCGLTADELDEYLKTYATKVNQTCKRWKSKFLMVVGSMDPLTPNYVKDMQDYPIHYLRVAGGGHLTHDVLWYASQIVNYWALHQEVNIKQSMDYINQKCAARVIKH